MSTGIQGAFEDIVGRAADTDNWGNAERGDGSDGVMHGIVSNVSVLTVNDDTVNASQGHDLGLADGGDGHEGHERELAGFDLVEKSQSRVID
jgi:hypothetical protein